MQMRNQRVPEQIKGALWLSVIFGALVALVQMSSGADVLVQPGNVQDLRSKIDNTPANTRLDLGGSTFDVGGTQLFINRSLLTLANGTIKGDALPKFVSPGDKDSRNFLVLVGADSRGLAFENVRLASNNGVMWVRPGSQDFFFHDCTATWGTNGNYYNKHAFHFEAGGNGHLRASSRTTASAPRPTPIASAKRGTCATAASATTSSSSAATAGTSWTWPARSS
jgi:hypothetical protein